MPSWIPAYAETVGAMLEANACVVACCTRCKAHRDVDLPKLVAAKGRSYSLLNRRCPCNLTLGCKGWNRFLYSASKTTPVRSLWVDDEVYPRWYDMFGKDGRGSR